MARWIGAQGQVTSAQKVRKLASIMTSLTRNPNPRTKIFFKSKLEDFPNP